MALHKKGKIREELLDDAYASTDLSVAMPKYKIPEKEHAPRHSCQAVHDEFMLDDCINKNMINKDEYPQSVEIEGRCVHVPADLWNSPDAANTLGCATTGSSEASMRTRQHEKKVVMSFIATHDSLIKCSLRVGIKDQLRTPSNKAMRNQLNQCK